MDAVTRSSSQHPKSGKNGGLANTLYFYTIFIKHILIYLNINFGVDLTSGVCLMGTPGLKPKNVGPRDSVNFFSDSYSKSAVESKYDHHLNQKIRLEELFAFFEKVIW